MPSGRDDLARTSAVSESSLIKFLRVITSAALAIMIIALVALIFAPKDPGTLTLYGLVIGLNLLTFLIFWPTAKWLQRANRKPHA